MYKFDLHVHTNTSRCGFIPPEMLIPIYKKAGYSGFLITDHYYQDFWAMLSGFSRNDMAEAFLSGHKAAVKAGKHLDFDVLLGCELRPDSLRSDLLLVGMTEEIIRSGPELNSFSPEDLHLFCLKHDIMIIQAHPFRKDNDLFPPEFLDGIEVLNSAPNHESNNHLALEYAKKCNLIKTAGSDTHRPVQAARSGIATNERVQNSDQLKSILRNQNFEIIIPYTL